MGSSETLRDETGVTLRLSGAWTVEHAASLRRELLELLATADAARLDVAGVDNVDATFFEMVHGACVSAARDAKSFSRVGPLSDAARRTAALSGFAEYGPFADFWKEEERHE
jgi:ABC-type transporter Mla MlaB component